jgi:hypothetical protein
MAKIGKSRLEALYLLVFVGFWYLLLKMPGLDGYWLLAFLGLSLEMRGTSISEKIRG